LGELGGGDGEGAAAELTEEEAGPEVADEKRARRGSAAESPIGIWKLTTCS
jgi:hypothetical protein